MTLVGSASDQNSLIVLDAVAAFSICTGDALGTHLMSSYELGTRQPKQLISILTVGEILRIAEAAEYAKEEISEIHRILSQFQIVDVKREIVESFAVIAGSLDRDGKTMSSPKVWTAATCAVVGQGSLKSVLLTCNPDYKVFQPYGITIEFVDPTPFRPASI